MFVNSHEVLAGGCFRWILAPVRDLGIQMSHVRTTKIGGLDCPECMCFVNILGRRLLAERTNRLPVLCALYEGRV